MRWYFSHPTSDANTLFDNAVRQHFAAMHLESPNKNLHLHGYQLMGMEYLFFAMAMLPAYDGCVTLELPNGRWSAGVTREVNWFLQNDRPVFRLCYDVAPEDTLSFHLTLLTDPIDEPCSVEQTRALVHYYQKRPLGGRSYEDRLLKPTWTELGLPEPEKVAHPPIY